MGKDSSGAEAVLRRSGDRGLVFLRTSACSGGDGTSDQSTSEAFWRRKGTDADGAAGA